MFGKERLMRRTSGSRSGRELHRYGLAGVNINYAYSSRGKNIHFTLNGRGCEEIVFEHLEQLASPNLDSDSQESVFYRVETLFIIETRVFYWELNHS